MVTEMRAPNGLPRQILLRHSLSVLLLGAALVLPVAIALSSGEQQSLVSSQIPFTDNPLGPIENVTSDWTYYQPATDFCITPDVYEVPSFTGSPCAVTVGRRMASKGTVVSPGTKTTGTYEVKIDTPRLCAQCVRLFIDYRKIPANDGTSMYSHGHAYFRLMSFNFTYASDPVAHSPNIKNLTNDYLVAPPGSTNSAVTSQIDPHLLTYAADSANYAHNDTQGPYYVGPGYFNNAGTWINGAYVDVDIENAKEIGTAELDEIVYGAAFDSNPPGCLDSKVGGSTYTDGNYFYGGCINWGGGDPSGVSPWPDGK